MDLKQTSESSSVSVHMTDCGGIADQMVEVYRKSESISKTDALDSDAQIEERSIAAALIAESLFALGCSVVAGIGWSVHIGLSLLLGTGAYLFPYAIVFFVFFYRFARWHRSANEKMGIQLQPEQPQYKKHKRTIVGGFLLAEVVKIVLTLGILIAAMMWYRQANWSVVLISFGVAIQANWVALWFALRRTA